MQHLTLYRVDGRKRVFLDDLHTEGVDLYTGQRDETGVVTLTPVRVAAATTRRGSDMATHLVEDEG